MKLPHMLPTLAAIAFLSSVGLFAQSASMASFHSARARFAEDKSIRPFAFKVPKEALTDSTTSRSIGLRIRQPLRRVSTGRTLRTTSTPSTSRSRPQ